MRLTNTIRDAFVRAAMNDVPSVDYDEIAAKKVQDYAYQHLPPEIKKVYDKPALRTYLEKTHTRLPSPLWDAHVVTADTSYWWPEAVPTLWAELEALAEQKTAQEDTRCGLEAKLRAVAYSATTRKALEAALPEFAQYLPAKAAAPKNLPAVANVVADFAKAGWPKNATQAESAAV